jgi:hypothetical protein
MAIRAGSPEGKQERAWFYSAGDLLGRHHRLSRAARSAGGC